MPGRRFVNIHKNRIRNRRKFVQNDEEKFCKRVDNSGILWYNVDTEKERGDTKMTTITLNNKIERQYKNNGQHAEQVMRFTLTGEIVKADNKSHKLGGDVLDIQIKSQKATVCKGYDINAYLALDGANRFAYVTSDFATAYVMSKAEYIEFVKEFGCKTRESTKNGGGEKIQLLSESKRMLEWFGARA